VRSLYEPLTSFDVAGVCSGAQQAVVGFVRRERLTRGVVKDHVEAITHDVLIAESTPLADLFGVLASKESAFVLTGNRVSGIVTRADLNKPVARIYLFGLISLLEMHLTFWIDRYYPEDSWRDHVNERRMESALVHQEERRKSNDVMPLLQCLQFADKRQGSSTSPAVRLNGSRIFKAGYPIFETGRGATEQARAQQ
jgi:hypothetical protein